MKTSPQPETQPDFSQMRRDGALSKSVAHFARPRGADLLGRVAGYARWRETRQSHQAWPYSRSLDGPTGPSASIRYDDGHAATGLNFASQDYLGLANHPAIHQAATEAISEWGVHSAGSAGLLGNTGSSLALEEELAEAIGMEHIALFPTGWGAGFGVIAALIRAHDHVVMDELSHACLQQGAQAATPNVHRFRHNDLDHLRTLLRDIRSVDLKGGILVVTEGLFSMDSDVPPIRPIQSACHEYEATLLVDVAHDFGSMGPGGTGSLGRQELLGEVDLVMGSFSKTFASNGGFVATNSGAVKQFVKYYGGPHLFSNALSPIQTSIVREALRIVRSPEGDQLRDRSFRASTALRKRFRDLGIEVLGEASPIVPALVGNDAVGRIASRLLYHANLFANLVEFPAVPIGRCRFRLQVMATHTESQVAEAAETVSQAIHKARELCPL